MEGSLDLEQKSGYPVIGFTVAFVEACIYQFLTQDHLRFGHRNLFDVLG